LDVVLHDANQREEANNIQEQTASFTPGGMSHLIYQGSTFHQLGKYQEATNAYMQAIRQNLHSVMKGSYKGDAETDLQKAEEALVLTPHSVAVYRDKISALLELQRYEEVLLACEQIMHPGCYVIAVDYNNKAYAFNALKRYEEALLA